MYKNVGKWWNDDNIDLVELDGVVYALYGWNGEIYSDCWACSDDNFHMDITKGGITIRPVYSSEEEPQIVDYEVL